MTGPTYLMVMGGCGALLALMLSITPLVIAARRTAIAALWLSIAVVPLAVALDLSELAAGGAAISGVTVFTQVMAHVRSYGAIALPCAFVASLALKRAAAARKR